MKQIRAATELFCCTIAVASAAGSTMKKTMAFTISSPVQQRKLNPLKITSSTFPTILSAPPPMTTTTTTLRLQRNPWSSHESFASLLSSPLLLSTNAASCFNHIFQYSGNVPLASSLALNAILFFTLRPKLMTMLTPTGFAHSLALGTMLWTALGYRGWTVCVLYLFLGQLVTKIGFDIKQKMGIAEGRGGRRGPENVWGSALTGTLCAAAAAQALLLQSSTFLGLSSSVWILGYVASLATKLADTFASEIGKAYGKTTFLITTLQSVPRGTEGAISLEGTLASIVGGLLLSVYAYLVVGLIPSVQGVGVATLAAFLATMVESWIGATLQGKKGLRWMTNEVVNFFNTLIGAIIAMSLGVFVLGM